MLASHYSGNQSIVPNIYLILLFSIGAFVMRGAGCVVNDLWDRKADALVERTKGRPLPSGRVTATRAILFLSFLSLIGLYILLQLNPFTQMVGLLSIVLIVIYPLMKRITYWPQLMLGLTFNWGALMGWSAVSGSLELPAIVLYIAGIFWTLGYDTIYAHQDKEDDILVGVKSTALKLADKTRVWLSGFYSITFLLITYAGFLSHLGIGFFTGMIFAAWHLFYQLKKLDIDDRELCLALFKSNHHFGAIVFISMLFGHLF